MREEVMRMRLKSALGINFTRDGLHSNRVLVHLAGCIDAANASIA